MKILRPFLTTGSLGLLLLILGMLAYACRSTQVYPRIKCLSCIPQEEKILLLPLDWDPGFQSLTQTERNRLESALLTYLQSERYTQVERYDDLEYELLNAGISDLEDPVHRAQLNLDLGFRYLLALRLSESGWAGKWNPLHPDVPEEGSDWEEDTRIYSMVRVAMIETASGRFAGDYAVATQIDGMPIPIGEGEVVSLNFGSVEQAIRVSAKKGLQELLKDCSC